MIEIDAALVERKLIEHFAPGERGEARAALEIVESPRVQLAAVRLSEGDVPTLERYALLSTIDARDVIAPAESPRYIAAGIHAHKRPDADELVESDRRDYQAWIERPGPFSGSDEA